MPIHTSVDDICNKDTSFFGYLLSQSKVWNLWFNNGTRLNSLENGNDALLFALLDSLVDALGGVDYVALLVSQVHEHIIDAI